MHYGPPAVSEPTRVRVKNLAHGGAGVGTAVEGEGPTIFVEGALPGELVDVHIEHRARRWTRGRVAAVLEPAPERVEPPCALADRCGGCGWQHVDPAAQARLKRDIVAGQLRRLPLAVGPGVPSPHALGYRRRARMHWERRGSELALGFFRSRSRELVDVPTCPVLRPELDRALTRMRELAPRLPERGELHALSDGTRVVIGLPGVAPDERRVDAARALLDGEVAGIVLRGHRRRQAVGASELELDGGPGRIPVHAGPLVFSQAQAEQNAVLVDAVVGGARPDGKGVLELHAGVGNFTRALAVRARRVWTFDEDREAVASLQRTVAAQGLPVNAKHGQAERELHKLARRGDGHDVVVVDPPRAGLGRGPARDLARVARERAVYVSCDPSTLARDLEVAIAEGLRVVDVQVLDMMPMTPEVEVVATLAAGGTR
jgi:23S rRNA (uracil1939-C5)-methyltransferase